MNQPFLGAGASFGGNSLFGFGAPARSNAIGGVPFIKDNGQMGTIRKINPVTRDFEIDPITGNIEGLNLVQQQVYLALATKLGSSASPELGNTLHRVQTIGQGTDTQIKNAVNNALGALVASKSIILNQVNVLGDSVKTRRLVQIIWTDTSTLETQETLI